MEEAEKAKEEAEQYGYEIGVIETKEALRAEVAEVCRFYYLQVWNEALNQTGVEASSAFRGADNVYYPPAIRTSSSSGSKAGQVSSEADEGKESPPKVPSTANISSKEAGQSEDVEKTANTTKEGAHDAVQPPIAPRNLSKEKNASQSMEIVLATLPIPSKEDLKGKGQSSTTIASTQPPKNPMDKLVIKMKS